MNAKKYIILILSTLMTAACSHIDEDEQLIYVKPEPAKRVVLLEDFTGQRCVNCPNATEIIEQLQQTYGDSAFIAVAIHGGPLGFSGNATLTGLATSAGDEYFNHWNLEYQPVGMVNRHEAVNYTDWATAVKEEMAKAAPLEMKMSASLKQGQIIIKLKVFGVDGSTTGKLQIWLLEDQITALQLMPDGTANTNYVHSHVLRSPVNGLWGEDFTIHEGETKEQTMSFLTDEAWNPRHLSLVAFVYNNDGVHQAVKAKVIINNNENDNENEN